MSRLKIKIFVQETHPCLLVPLGISPEADQLQNELEAQLPDIIAQFNQALPNLTRYLQTVIKILSGSSQT